MFLLPFIIMGELIKTSCVTSSSLRSLRAIRRAAREIFCASKVAPPVAKKEPLVNQQIGDSVSTFGQRTNVTSPTTRALIDLIGRLVSAPSRPLL